MKKYSIWLCAAFGSIALVELFFFSPPALGWTLFFFTCIALYFLCFGVKELPKAVDWVLIASVIGLALPFVLFNNSALRWFNFIAIGLCLLVLFARKVAPEDIGWDKLAFYGEVFAGNIARPFAYLLKPWRTKKPMQAAHPGQVGQSGMNYDPATGQFINTGQAPPAAAAAPEDCPLKQEQKIQRRKTIASQVALALLVSIPLLSVLGTFLYHSDPVFASWVDAAVRFIVNLNIGTIILHATIMAAIFPFALSFFWSYGKSKLVTISKSNPANRNPVHPNPNFNPAFTDAVAPTGALAAPAADNGRIKFKLPSVFSATLLLMINLLYFVYAIVQFRFLFAGTSGSLPEGLGLIYADYARSGFFELVTLALFNFVLIAVSAYFTHREGRAGIVLRCLTIALVALSTIQLASALTRMILYVEAFGLSQLRLFVFAYIAFIAVIFILFIVRELLSKRATPLFRVAALSALALLLGMNYAVPDALIARYNLERQIVGELKVQRVDFDYYAYHLSFDSVRVLLEMEDRLLEAHPDLQSDFT
ncbi:MAG: DUF4173 domain-containing protein, partial [Coriobacteriia bacterium]|nr:DUF4173 domain-containing protein [Coriobacteriia bacterium]